MEKSVATTTGHYLETVLQEPCGIILFLEFLAWCISMFNMFLPSSCQSCNCNHSPAEKAVQESILTEKEVTKTRNKNQDNDMELTHDDINVVMRNIGQDFGQENSMVCKSIGNDSIARIFDEDEPSLQEVWQAFLVFDHNHDGYFDASDLERVLQSLGLGEGVGVDECEQMIAKYDTNKDRRIDMAEFTKVLEAGIC
ncbi:hypothetical protein SETIT_8G176000v2 [Setaria italica]|uniref:EF-hand domain-containing protein n=1 Tax=Setaria italica TaxID=4555 RepID=K3ZLH7_SETIT|nr:probable calcium-binding protein CML45 [Setaria italica]RCV38856.1 hypothetical protein SETIT_8G176000v2 [Setaria italica]